MPRSHTVSVPAISATDIHPGFVAYNHLLMSDKAFITIGAQAQMSSPRLNIVSLQQDEKQVSLFVQALSD
jgi:hypothetical protein